MPFMEAADPIDNPAFPKAKAKPLRFKSADDSAKQRERDTRYDSSRRRHRRRRQRHGDDDKHGSRNYSSKRGEHKHKQPQLGPDAAFRESLFDAMADDEGADYWANVYGQPIHEFPQERVGPDGELERMTEDEYTEFVRAEMWKKTNAGFLEEKERRAKARKEAEETDRQAKEFRARVAKEDHDFKRRIDASLRKGQEREERRKNREAWDRYQAAWELLGQGSAEDPAPEVPWPSLDQRKADPGAHDIEAFMRYASDISDGRGTSLRGFLKAERVRWHPDKVQQRAKGRLDEPTIRKVTAIFQVIDDLWMKHRD